MGGHWPAPVTVSAVHRAGHCGRLRGCECDCEWQELPARAAGGCGSLPPAPLPATWQGRCSTAGRQLCWPSSGDTGWGGGSLQAGPELPPNAPQVCVDGGCYTLGKVVRPGLEGVPQSTLLGVLLALLLLVAVLAAILVFSYHRRKQLGEPSTAILTQPSPPNYDVSKPLYPLSVQALGVCPHLLGLGQPLGPWSGWLLAGIFPQFFLRTWKTWPPWTGPLEPCLCLCSAQALTTEMALVRCWRC